MTEPTEGSPTRAPEAPDLAQVFQQAVLAMAQQNAVLVELAEKLALMATTPLQAVPAQAQMTSPLNKRECFAGFVLMGLTSRLQPIQNNNAIDKKKLVDLAFEMAELALSNCVSQ